MYQQQEPEQNGWIGLHVFLLLCLLLVPARLTAVVFGYPLFPTGYGFLALFRDAAVGLVFWFVVSSFFLSSFGFSGAYFIAVAIGVVTFIGVLLVTQGEFVKLSITAGLVMTSVVSLVIWAGHQDGAW